MSLILATAPAVLPISLVEAKAHLRIDDEDSDAIVAALLEAARQHLDGRDGLLGRALITQTWDLKLDCFPAKIRLPLPPFQSVTSITYTDAAGDEQTLDAAEYQVVGVGGQGHIVPAYNHTWPATRYVPESVTVRFVAGYGDDPSDVPEPVRHAILLLVGHLFENREAVSVTQMHELPMAVESLITPYRVWSL